MNYTMVYLKWEACLVRGYMGYRDYNACGADVGGEGEGGGERQTGISGYKEASEIRAQQPDDIACRCCPRVPRRFYLRRVRVCA